MMTAFLTAFASVLLAEFGDKTQLVSLSMACRYPPLQVLGGALLALFLVLALAVGLGELIAAWFPRPAIVLASGVFFVLMGVYTLLSREREKAACTGRAGFYQTLGAIFLAEMGDKTQLATLLLAANFGRPLAVLAGAMLAMIVNHSLAVFLGARFFSRLNPRHLKVGAAVLFIAIGIFVIALR